MRACMTKSNAGAGTVMLLDVGWELTGGELELVGGLQVGITGRPVGGSVILKVEKKGEHGLRTGGGTRQHAASHPSLEKTRRNKLQPVP